MCEGRFEFHSEPVLLAICVPHRWCEFIVETDAVASLGRVSAHILGGEAEADMPCQVQMMVTFANWRN